MGLSLGRLATGLRYSSILTKTAVLGAWDREASRRYLLASLGSMPGLGAKISQLLAMRMGEDPNENPVSLEPMPLELVKARIEEESPHLHQELEEIYPAAQVASLGQVHRARLRNGEELAIKVQFPYLREGMEETLALLKTVSKVGPPKKFQFETDALIDYFQSSLLQELDYTHEAKQQEEVRKSLPMGWPLRVAHVYPEFSGPRLLVQSYEASSSLAEIKALWPYEARQQCAQNLLAYFLDALFRVGLLHTDPHPGNLGFRPAKGLGQGYSYELVLYDFGSMMRIPRRERSILWRVISAYQKQEDLVPFDYLCALGFDPEKLLSSAERLPAIFRKLWEPFCVEGAYDFASWQLKETFENVLGEDRWWFRSAGPPWFLMLMRSAQGLLHAIAELEVRVPVKMIFRELNLAFEDYPVTPLLKSMAPEHKGSSQILAQHLCVNVWEQSGEELVSLEMPAHCVDSLEEIIPPETLERMQEQGVNLQQLQRKVQASGYLPQEIFEAHSKDRRYRVWLR